ncbi:hypothetical protein SDC9_133425 [bioreactor metagenome]|uniref:Uncharacterized protein n=1 Tax=bioreactor metagenome TaxID=1076179 RepID=A0A645DA83_9ZZZZ
MPNIQNLFWEIIFLRKLRATIPTKKVTTKAKRLFEVIILSERISLKLSKMAPAEAGINKLKEKLNALIGERPNKRAAKIVQPERETPGRMAKA